MVLIFEASSLHLTSGEANNVRQSLAKQKAKRLQATLSASADSSGAGICLAVTLTHGPVSSADPLLIAYALFSSSEL